MTAKKQSPIKLKEIIAQANKLDVMSTYVVDAETKKIIKYNKVFDKSKVEELTLELFEDMQYAIANEYNFFESDEQLIKYELLLIVKYFTHFKDEIGDTFEDKINALEALMRTGLLDIIFEDVLDKDQVVDVIEQINKVAERAILASDAIEKSLEVNGETN